MADKPTNDSQTRFRAALPQGRRGTHVRELARTAGVYLGREYGATALKNTYTYHRSASILSSTQKRTQEEGEGSILTDASLFPELDFLHPRLIKRRSAAPPSPCGINTRVSTKQRASVGPWSEPFLNSPWHCSYEPSSFCPGSYDWRRTAYIYIHLKNKTKTKTPAIPRYQQLCPPGPTKTKEHDNLEHSTGYLGTKSHNYLLPHADNLGSPGTQPRQPPIQNQVPHHQSQKY